MPHIVKTGEKAGPSTSSFLKPDVVYQVFAPSLYPSAGFGIAALRLFAGFTTPGGNGEEALCSGSEGMSPADGEGPRGRFDAENY